jgi:hypothetical protein
MSDDITAGRLESIQLDLIRWLLHGDHTLQELRAAVVSVEAVLRKQLNETTEVSQRRKIERALGINR